MAADRDTVLLVNPGTDLYGSDRMLVETARALVKAGLRTVVALPHDGPLRSLLEAEGVEVTLRGTPILRKSSLSARGLLNLVRETAVAVLPTWRLIRTLRPRAIITNTITMPLWLLLGPLAGVPTMCHVHEAEQSVPRWVRRGLYLPLAFTDRVIVNSRYTGRIMLDSAPWLARRTRLVYNAVRPPAAAEPLAESPADPVRLVFIGRLSHRKGPQVAIRAVDRLRDRGVPASLQLLGAVVPGAEDFEAQLRHEIAQLGLHDSVDFLGFRADPWPVLAGADIVVVPSVMDESFGNTAVEAGLAARPLIVSDTSGLQEATMHSQSALRVPPDDQDAIADAVEAVLADWSRYRELAADDAVRLRQEFGEDTYADKIVSVIVADRQH